MKLQTSMLLFYFLKQAFFASFFHFIMMMPIQCTIVFKKAMCLNAKFLKKNEFSEELLGCTSEVTIAMLPGDPAPGNVDEHLFP